MIPVHRQDESKTRPPTLTTEPRKRLKSGMGEKEANASTLRRVRFGWKKFAIAVLGFIGLVWTFGPWKRETFLQKYIPGGLNHSYQSAHVDSVQLATDNVR